MIKCRKGFTNVELMIVLGVIILLMGMVLIGFKVVGDSGKKGATRAALETYRTMLNELEAAGVLTRVKDLYGSDYAKAIDNPGKIPPIDNDPKGLTRTRAVWSGNRGSTANVLKQLYSMPNNRKILESLPAERVARVPANPNNANSDSVVVLLDGWDNPIIFVPAGGLGGFVIQGNVPASFTSVGLVPKPPPLPHGASGFFASAGPDGDFGTGDDNLYSFEN